MRAHKPGGRFDADFETTAILKGVDTDLKHPVGTNADWWVFDSVNTELDPIYDVGQDITSSVGGKVWTGPYSVPVVRAVIKQGEARTSAVGFYNSDTLHLTLLSAQISTTVTVWSGVVRYTAHMLSKSAELLLTDLPSSA